MGPELSTATSSSVRQTGGPGIPAEHQAEIFEPFHQVDNSNTTSDLPVALADKRLIKLASRTRLRIGDGRASPVTGPCGRRHP